MSQKTPGFQKLKIDMFPQTQVAYLKTLKRLKQFGASKNHLFLLKNGV